MPPVITTRVPDVSASVHKGASNLKRPDEWHSFRLPGRRATNIGLAVLRILEMRLELVLETYFFFSISKRMAGERDSRLYGTIGRELSISDDMEVRSCQDR